jgi:hypothetical protein
VAEEYEKDRRRWHVKKEISLGDAVAIVSAALAIVYSYSTLDKRVSLLEEFRLEQTKTDGRQDGDALRYQARIDATLAEINKKLDRLIERGR